MRGGVSPLHEAGNWILPLPAQPLHLRQSWYSSYRHCFEAERSLSDDPSFMAAMTDGQIMDPSQLQYYLTSGEFNGNEGMENLRSAVKEFKRSNV
jgi:hypothetical protein